MKLKTRLTVACLSIVMGTVLLVSAVFMWIFGSRMKTLENSSGNEIHLESILNAVQTLSESTNEIWEELEKDSEEDPDRFLNFSYLQEKNAALHEKFSYLLVVKNGEVFYVGDEKTDWSEDLSQLEAYDETVSSAGYYVGGSKRSMVKQINILFTDGSNGCAYIVTAFSEVSTEFRAAFLEIIVLIILVLCAVVLIMTVWIYNGISRPVMNLRGAAMRISNGDYDFTVPSEGDDEISQLCRDFEQMRKRLKESEEQKEKYDSENRELISNISHDLKTPITTIKGYVEGIIDGVADTPEKMQHYIRTIYNKANDMDRLVNELTFYSKIDTNRIPYHFTRLNVGDFFEDCAEEVSLDLKESNIRFSYVNRTGPDTLIIADPEQLKRVMDNIIGNAVKYMDKSEGSIALRIMDAGDFIQAELEDNGKGIDTKDLPNIFDRFYRTDASRGSSTGGSGIGLSIVKKIIEDHSGRIWATSRLGRGTTIHFVIRKYQEG